MRLSKNEFCNAVNQYKAMLTEENNIANILNVNFEWKPGEWITNYYELLSELCELEEDSIYGSDLDWFCFETDFGRRKDMCKVFDTNTGNTWTIETPETLYDFITRDE